MQRRAVTAKARQVIAWIQNHGARSGLGTRTKALAQSGVGAWRRVTSAGRDLFRNAPLRELAASGVALVVVVTCAGKTNQGPEHPALASSAVVAPVSIPSSSSRSMTSPSASGRSEPPATAPPAMSLDVSPLARFRRALAELRARQRSEPVRILWFGDSHTAADYWPNAVRDRLAGQVRLGGPGFLTVGMPRYRHAGARVTADPPFDIGPHPPARRSAEDDGVFGLAGVRATADAVGSLVTVRLTSGSGVDKVRYQLTYRLRNPGDALRMKAGSEQLELRAPVSEAEPSGLARAELVALFDAPLTIRVLSGKPELYGVVAESVEPGLVIDTLGINGARLSTPLAWNEPAWRPLVAQRNPALTIVAYGTNEVFDQDAISRHTKHLETLVGRVRAAVPDSDCLVAGPTDVGRGGPEAAQRVAALDAAEQRTAEQLGCEYFSPYRLMIAEGGFVHWMSTDPPLALVDRIHLSVQGYQRLGRALADVLLGSPTDQGAVPAAAGTVAPGPRP